MAVSWFSTPDSVDAVLEFYERAFAEQKRHPVTQKVSDSIGYVAWLEEMPDAGLAGGAMHMVSVMKQFSQTMVLLSASRPDLFMASSTQLPEGLKLPPEATAPQSIQMSEDESSNEVIHTQVLNTSSATVVHFFESQFKEKGYSIGQPSPSLLVASKASTTVTVAVQQQAAHSSVVLTYERRAPQETAP